MRCQPPVRASLDGNPFFAKSTSATDRASRTSLAQSLDGHLVEASVALAVREVGMCRAPSTRTRAVIIR